MARLMLRSVVQTRNICRLATSHSTWCSASTDSITFGAISKAYAVRNPNKPPGGHHGTDVPTREELDRMLGEAGFEIVLSRVSLGRMKAVVQRPVRQVAPDAA